MLVLIFCLGLSPIWVIILAQAQVLDLTAILGLAFGSPIQTIEFQKEYENLLSLNFKHIILNKTRNFTYEINKRFGYNNIYIQSPVDAIMEVIDNE
ncbi:MAG: hypothetical protein LBF58_02845 [Deltaproteobacteria bacterium]|jgi:hypothetical protein|nr:hypothetical protein [Deltaproteobacteria bacterium]